MIELLDGLRVVDVSTSPTGLGVILFVIGFFGEAAVLATTFILFEDWSKKNYIIAAVVFTVLVLLIIFAANSKITNETTYEVIIEDYSKVSYYDIANKYDIVRQDGDLFTIKEK